MCLKKCYVVSLTHFVFFLGTQEDRISKIPCQLDGSIVTEFAQDNVCQSMPYLTKYLPEHGNFYACFLFHENFKDRLLKMVVPQDGYINNCMEQSSLPTVLDYEVSKQTQLLY